MNDMLATTASLLRPEEHERLHHLLAELHEGRYPQLAQITARSSYYPLTVVYIICSQQRQPWTVYERCRNFWECWKCLPEDAKAGRASELARHLISTTLHLINTSYGSLLELLPASATPAIIDPETGLVTSHESLRRIITAFALPTTCTKPVVAISLPNGPLLATVLLATSTYYTAAPIQHGAGVGPEQFRRDVLQSGATFILVTSADISRLQLRATWITDAGIQVYIIEMRNTLHLSTLDGTLCERGAWSRPKPSQAGDIAILLFTSGTSGKKKLVPLHIETLVTGVAMVQDSWGLSSSSRCLNQMPLNHVGGIVRNLFAPILSGGSVICCSGFDAHAFWDIVDDYQPTWYYASPTMHQCILDAAVDRPESVANSRITLVCNAAGGLLPSLARQLQQTFKCTVLPSYGMTECMPISTPSLDYKLDRIGTSGVSVGPEIAILDNNDNHMRSGSVGRIAVRGAPSFAGYLIDTVFDRSCFTRDGWFDTGDMGYLDEAGYLYITGRSKEVINRGGELISPFEVEDAVLAAAKSPTSPIFGRVRKALAFSVPHDVLQEIVGMVIVTPSYGKRPSLQTIQEATRSSLASVKVPTLLVYMDDLPTNNNKVLRIRLAERLSIPSVSDETPQAHRYYEATCPAAGTPLTTNIPSRLLATYREELQAACMRVLPPAIDSHIPSGSADIQPEIWLAPRDNRTSMDHITEAELKQQLHAVLDAYYVPLHVYHSNYPFRRHQNGTVDETRSNPSPQTDSLNKSSITETKVTLAFAEVLAIPIHTLTATSNFFDLGGDSMKAGRLLSVLRKSFSSRITIDILFNNGSISALTELLKDSTDVAKQEENSSNMIKSLPGCREIHSSTYIPLLILQLLPICLIAPLRRALTWTFFIYSLTFSYQLETKDSLPGRFINLVISLLLGKLVADTVAPVVGIISKWIIIGRYKEGLYPMWAAYHTRWWIVSKILDIMGLGIYEHFNCTRLLYYRCLGAQIGRRTIIDKSAKLGEYDLLSIGDDAVLDACNVRPFAVERNTSMYLGRIHIGSRVSIGVSSFIAAGTTVPSNTCIGANSSSWELDDANEANRLLSTSQEPKPSWMLEWLVGFPLVVLAHFVGGIPWMGGLMPLVISEPKHNTSDPLREIIIWFSSPQRVVFHYVALGCRSALGPIFFMLIVLAMKNTLDACCGQSLQAGPVGSRSQFDRLRMYLMRQLMHTKNFHQTTALFGTHYSVTSWFARRLGARVGKDVYWPGNGPTIQDFDMLEVGDSVVFGSRSHIITSDGLGMKKVTIDAGAMVADRVVLRPGVKLGQNTIMGSGALTQRSKEYPANTTWVGSQKNDAVCLTFEPSKPTRRSVIYQGTVNAADKKSIFVSASPYDSRQSSMYDVKSQSEIFLQEETLEDQLLNTTSPFARAFYHGLAPYKVWSQFSIAIYSTSITVLCAVFWNIHSIGAIQLIAWVYRQGEYEQGFLQARELRPFFIYAFFTALISAIMFVQIVLTLGIIIAAKWIIIGRRKQGNYDWDKSSYCQRWQLFLKIESLRQKCYAGHGILGLLTGTYWISLYFKALGAEIGKDCALFASGTPSLYFTEPDLLTLGDRVSVDDASLVCHINTRGKFDLNPLVVGNRSVLRSGSRLLSGATMEADSCLLEHTLVMAGDIVDQETTFQGWPATKFDGNRLPTLRVGYHWETA